MHPCQPGRIHHFELESLPSGEWGYLHFPVTARYARTLGLDCMGMTGKFHTEWGDFHSLKNQAALEFECFRMLSYGYAVSIGDQLELWGFESGCYQLIGKVFHQLKEREAWARPSKALVEAALVTSEPIPCEHQIPESVFGAVQLLEELALQFDVVDLEAPLDQYSLVILPDDLAVTPEYQRKLNDYAAKGGKIIACAKGGLNSENAYPDCFGASYQGKENLWPSFLLPRGPMAKGLAENNEYVIYLQGERIIPAEAKPFSHCASRISAGQASIFVPTSTLPPQRAPNSRRLSGMETLLCSRIPCLPNTAKMPLSGANGSYPTPLICFCQKDWSATTALPL